MISSALERGNVYWVNLDPTIGSEIKKKRPCVIVSATPINQARRTVVVVPLSTATKARPPLVIAVNCLERQAFAVCDQVRAIDKSRLTQHIGQISVNNLIELENGLRLVFSI